ncbi:DUF6228 family protein [Streptomyces sp. NPDC048182]|uniref:DUF6228 family protein n=1 Tax=Streptomyces sp. NPDC048182 TaxID=3365507 RepID=UPI00372261A5
MIDYDDSGRLAVRVGAPTAPTLLLAEPHRPYPEDPTLDFLIRAAGPWGSVETSVETWDGDALDVFLTALAEDFRGWEGARTWGSLSYDLTLSAEHRSGGCVELTWGIHDRPGSDQWHFEVVTAHEAGEGMRTLAAEVRAFLAGA